MDKPVCKACGRPMILAEECTIGCPDHHVEGSRVTYCAYCGPIPTMPLDEPPRSFRLVPNGGANTASPMQAQAEKMIHTSIDDLRSTLSCAAHNGRLDPHVLSCARDLAASMGHITRVRLLERYMRLAAKKGE